MKLIKKFYFIIITIVLFNSCKKEEENNSMEFKITGVSNTSIIVGQTMDIGLKVFFLGGNKEEVKLTATGMPAGITINFSPDKGEPDFTLTETIHANMNADTGNFVITITGTSVDNNKTASKSFKLSVLAVPPLPNNPPVITLTNGADITSVLNSVFIDPGFTAMDVEDGDLTANVIVYGTVNKDSAAMYKISYVVYDSAGDKDSVVRTVRVKNDSEFLNGIYLCTPLTPNDTACLTNFVTSNFYNDSITLLNAVNCHTADLFFHVDHVLSKLYLNTQSGFFQGTMHTYNGQGTYTIGSSTISIHLDYTDNYVDTLGNNVSVNRIENYVK